LAQARPQRPAAPTRRAARRALLVIGLAVAFPVVTFLACLPASDPARAAGDPSLIARGLYIARLADCMACHTRPGGTPYAGGLEMSTPFGSLSTPNITPDPDTGIGDWSDEDFYRAGTDGIGRHGADLYPVMPYPSFTKMTRSDVMAVKAYLFSLKPVYAPRAPSHMAFPFDIRATLSVWRELYFHPGVYRPDPKRSAEWNRGAYIVEGPGHCGACHSPRNILGATETGESLAGGQVGHWLAPNISSDRRWGIGDWSVEDIVTFLKSGAQKTEGVAFGPMAEVVHDSLRYATPADLTAVAIFLKSGPERLPGAAGVIASRPDLRRGQKIYLENCAQCHQDKGRGIPGAVPNLAANAAVNSAEPNDVIDAVLNGLQGTGRYGAMPSFAGALGDQQVADVVNYVRDGWGNTAPTDATPALVASLRKPAGAGGAGSEAARAFDCPAVGASEIPNVLADPAEANFLVTADDQDMANKIDELIFRIQRDRPGISSTALFDSLDAAYCPVVADQPGMSNSQKRALLARFNNQLDQRIAAMSAGAGYDILANVPLPSNIMQLINDAAAAAHETPAKWMGQVLTKAATGQQ
jgi:mono/diheme cytochrome c family protein